MQRRSTTNVKKIYGIGTVNFDPDPSLPPLFRLSEFWAFVSQLTFPSLGHCSLLGPLWFLCARARSGVHRSPGSRTVRGGWRCRAGHHQAGESGPGVDGPGRYVCRRWPDRDGTGSRGGLGADGGKQHRLGLRGAG